MIYTLTGHILILALVCAVALVGARFDKDAGGYVDSFTTKATFPDKAVHFVCAVGLTFALARLMPPLMALGGTIFAGALYEIGQGYFSWYDFIADIAGAGITFGFITITQGVT